MLRRSSILLLGIFLVPGAGSGADEVHPVFPGCRVIKKGPDGEGCPAFDRSVHYYGLNTGNMIEYKRSN